VTYTHSCIHVTKFSSAYRWRLLLKLCSFCRTHVAPSWRADNGRGRPPQHWPHASRQRQPWCPRIRCQSTRCRFRVRLRDDRKHDRRRTAPQPYRSRHVDQHCRHQHPRPGPRERQHAPTVQIRGRRLQNLLHQSQRLQHEPSLARRRSRRIRRPFSLRRRLHRLPISPQHLLHSPSPRPSLDTDLDLAQSISLAGNDTLGYAHDLQAGPVRKTGEIKACGPSNQCDIGQCSITSLRCAGRDTPVRACLPSCSSNNPSCPAGADCDLDYRAPSKSNEVSNKIRSARLSQPLYFGLCRPTNPSPRLGCPK
jgi:hypothetical protein